jgi:hypothetical protein
MRHPTTKIALFLALLPATAAAQWGFQPQASSSAPPAMVRAAMTFDMIRGRTVMFDSIGDTWLWDGTSWTHAMTTNSPPPRRYSQLVFDPLRGVGVLYGGRGNNSSSTGSLDDTWLWDGTDWTLATPAATPGGRESYGAAFDLARGRFVLYGGRITSIPPVASSDMFEFDGTTWTQVTPPTSPGRLELQAMCYDGARAVTVMFGGIETGSGSGLATGTWTYDGVDWTQDNSLPQPAPRVQAHLVYDFNRGVTILHGGHDPTTMTFFNDTWEWRGSWQQVQGPVGSLSPPRAEGMMAMDSTRGRIVYFGGRDQNNAALDETWEYGGQFRTFGSGCAGSNGIPQLRAGSTSSFGTTFRTAITNLSTASPIALVVTGLDNRTSALGPLPQLLTAFGMPNCRLHVSPDLFQVVPASGGAAAWSWGVPPNTLLFGAKFYQQAVGLDAGVNAAGLTVSNAGAATIGW